MGIPFQLEPNCPALQVAPSTVKKKKGPPIIGQNEIGACPFSPLRKAQSLGKGKSERESTTTYDGLLVSGPVVPAAAWHPVGFSLVLWAIRTLAALKHSLSDPVHMAIQNTHTHTHMLWLYADHFHETVWCMIHSDTFHSMPCHFPLLLVEIH